MTRLTAGRDNGQDAVTTGSVSAFEGRVALTNGCGKKQSRYRLHLISRSVMFFVSVFCDRSLACMVCMHELDCNTSCCIHLLLLSAQIQVQVINPEFSLCVIPIRCITACGLEFLQSNIHWLRRCLSNLAIHHACLQHQNRRGHGIPTPRLEQAYPC